MFELFRIRGRHAHLPELRQLFLLARTKEIDFVAKEGTRLCSGLLLSLEFCVRIRRGHFFLPLISAPFHFSITN
jgi:hypothetical protein